MERTRLRAIAEHVIGLAVVVVCTAAAIYLILYLWECQPIMGHGSPGYWLFCMGLYCFAAWVGFDLCVVLIGQIWRLFRHRS